LRAGGFGVGWHDSFATPSASHAEQWTEEMAWRSG
jgi:hypothetical protein